MPTQQELIDAGTIKPGGGIFAGQVFDPPSWYRPPQPEPVPAAFGQKTPGATTGSNWRGAFGRSAATSAIPSLVGAGAGILAGTALTATGGGAIAGIPLIAASLGIGTAAGYGAGKLQEKLLTDEFKQQLARDAEEHPVASYAGQLAPSLLVGRPTNPLRLARGLVPGTVDPLARAAVREAIGGAAANAAGNVVAQSLEQATNPQAEFSAADILRDAAVGSLLAGKPWRNPLTRGIDAAAQVVHQGVPTLGGRSKPEYQGMFDAQNIERDTAEAIRQMQADDQPAVFKPVDIIPPEAAQSGTGSQTVAPAQQATPAVPVNNAIKPEDRIKWSKEITAEARASGRTLNRAEIEAELTKRADAAKADALRRATIFQANQGGIDSTALSSVGLDPDLAAGYPEALKQLAKIRSEAAKHNTRLSPSQEHTILTESAKLAIRKQQERAQKQLEKGQKAVAKATAEITAENDAIVAKQQDAILEQGPPQEGELPFDEPTVPIEGAGSNPRVPLGEPTVPTVEEAAPATAELYNEIFDQGIRRELDKVPLEAVDASFNEMMTGSLAYAQPVLRGKLAQYKQARAANQEEFARGLKEQPKAAVKEIATERIAADKAAEAETAAPLLEDYTQRMFDNWAQDWDNRKLPRPGAAREFEAKILRLPATQQQMLRRMFKAYDTARYATGQFQTQAAQQAPPADDNPRRKALTRGMYDLFRNTFGARIETPVELVPEAPKPGVKGRATPDDKAELYPGATQDTPAHEVFGHVFLNRAIDEDGTPLAKHAKRLQEVAAADPRYAKWATEAKASGLDSSVNEFIAQRLGERLAGDLLIDSAKNKYVSQPLSYQLGLLVKEFKRLFKTADTEDMMELVQQAMVYGAKPAVRTPRTTATPASSFNAATTEQAAQQSQEVSPEIPVWRSISAKDQTDNPVMLAHAIARPGGDGFLHFGSTKEQADNARWLHTGDRVTYEGKIHPGKLIQLTDDIFTDHRTYIDRVLTELQDRNILPAQDIERLETVSNNLSKRFHMADNKSRALANKSFNSALINTLRQLGYDGFSYPNSREGDGVSYALFPRRSGESIPKQLFEQFKQFKSSGQQSSEVSPEITTDVINAELTPKSREEAHYQFSTETAPQIGALRSIANEPAGKYVEEKLRRADYKRIALKGQFVNRGMRILQPLSRADANELYRLQIARKHGEDVRIPTRLVSTDNALRALLQDMHDYQREIGLPVREPDGTYREAQDNPDYVPEMTSARVYDVLSRRPESPEGQRLRQDFIEWKTAHYDGDESLAAAAFDQMFPRRGGAPKAEFNAARLSEGNGLPPSWRETDLARALRKYTTRMTTDFAFFEHVQQDPAMRQLLDINSDGTEPSSPKGTTLPDGTDISTISYGNNPHVIGALQDLMGGHSLMGVTAVAVTRLAKSMIIGIPAKLRDLATSPFIMAQASGLGDVIRNLPQAVLETGDGIRQARERGLADIGTDTWFDTVLDDASLLAQRVDAAADVVSKAQFLPQLEAVTRGFNWKLAHLIAQSKLTDPAFVRKWGDSTITEPAEQARFIADRITESTQGTYNFRGTPTWMRTSAIGPIFALNKWSVERWNNFREDIVKPALRGEVRPLLGAMFATVLGSAVIDELSEFIKGRKPEHLTWGEYLKLAESPEFGDATVSEETLFRLATAVSSAGTAGIMGDIVLQAHRMSSNRKSQEFGIPAVQVTLNLLKRAAQFADTPEAGLDDFAHAVLKDTMQTYRDAVSSSEDPQAQQKRDFRVYQRLQGDGNNVSIEFNPFAERANKMSPEEYARSKVGPGQPARLFEKKDPFRYERFLQTLDRDPVEVLRMQQEEDKNYSIRRAIRPERVR